MNTVWISAASLGGATLLGCVLGLFVKKMPHKWNDIVLGFCTGVMLAASTIGLILSGFDQAYGWLAKGVVCVGVLVGALFLNLLDIVTPHMHNITGLDPEQHKNNRLLNKVLLFVMAIALHKIPEGMAAGISMSCDEPSWSVTIGLSLQNIPEAMVIITPLMLAGVSAFRTMAISLGIGMLQVLGVWMGFGIGSISEFLIPVLLGFAGGAMLYVTSDEMIPETHTHGYQKQATYALLVGFMTLLIIDAL
ncbi:MAG: ZIP family metal transporter [Paludibacteraceae bacterium]|nr:ZIP family metal transporter [Paludibacteraceae bacterium]